MGIYQDDKLIKVYESGEQTSEVLPKIFEDILQKFTLKSLFYTNGPGSFMSIKVTYIFLRTLGIALSIPLKAVNGFAFNKNSPIKALGNQWFFKEKDSIVLRSIGETRVKNFALPQILDKNSFSDKADPLYILPAV